ncbi:tyrosine-type recombinase/integrase [Brevibacillus borstelensis]|uniref:tyrosine-type recombinase/integrase n=1 Tax=Brevibacillus borstelensis TaxID=45462 RepID=UPI002E2053AB|nr:tyrosine-type recombinase/integrase [Brevibacillus borstelensis]MED1874167.1 tyrosine-type recombinase/integrase [Brevibacillus borstelensis]
MALRDKRKPKLMRSTKTTAILHDWDELYSRYRNAKVAEGLAESTLGQRDRYHRFLMDFLNEKYPGIKPYEVTADVIRAWIVYLQTEHVRFANSPLAPEYMKTKGLATGCINTYLRNVKVFFNFLAKEGYIPESPFKHVKLMKEEIDTVQALNEKQVQALLAQPDKRSYAGFRDYVAMLIMLDCGTRLSSTINIRVEDVDFKEDVIYIRASNSKNRKGFYVPFSKKTKKALQELVAEAAEFNSEYLFTTVYGNKLDPSRLRQRMKKYGEAAGITGVRVSPHTLRHTFAKFYILNGGDPFSLQKILGHHDMTMVRRYVQMNDMDIRKQHERFSPMGFLR